MANSGDFEVLFARRDSLFLPWRYWIPYQLFLRLEVNLAASTNVSETNWNAFNLKELHVYI